MFYYNQILFYNRYQRLYISRNNIYNYHVNNYKDFKRIKLIFKT